MIKSPEKYGLLIKNIRTANKNNTENNNFNFLTLY